MSDNKDLLNYFNHSKYYSLKYKNYFPVYEKLFSKFRGKKITFVEIGVLSGGSLFMWKDYFGKDARIIGVELNPEAKKFEKYGFKIFTGDQSDPLFWKKFYKSNGKIDILIDDGGHTNLQQITTLMESVDNIKNNGVIFIEDTHTSYMNYKGLSEDRLYVLGQEIFENFIRNKIFTDMQNLVRESQAQGIKQVLITGNLDTVIAPLAEYLGVDDWVANRLEFDQDGLATGKLVPPILAGPEKAYWIRSYAKTHAINLEESHAYADSASDIPLLCAVGYPVAVNPDSRLKATADAHNWPIIRTKSI